MAKIISGGFKGMSSPQPKAISKPSPQQSAPEEQPGLFSRLGVSGLKGLAAPGIAVGQLIEYLGGLAGFQKPKVDAFGNPFPEASNEGLTKALGYTPEQVQAQSLPEDIAQRFIERAPMSGTLGGLGGLISSGVGSLVGGSAKHIGLGEGEADALQLASELAYGFTPTRFIEKLPYGKKIAEVSGKLTTIGSAQKTAQGILEKTAAKPYQAGIVTNAIKSVEDKLGTETTKIVADKVVEAIKKIQKNLTSGKINPHKAASLRANLYDTAKEMTSKKAAAYIEPLTKGINDFFTSYAAENPAFYKALKARDKLTELKNMSTLVDKFASVIPFQKVSKAVEGVLFAFKEPERFLRGILTNSEARKYYFDLFKASVKQDPALFLKNAENIAPFILPEVKQQESEKNQPTRNGKIIKGGFKI